MATSSSAGLYDRVYGALAAGALGDSIGGVTEMMNFQKIIDTFGSVDGPMATGGSTASARFDPGQKPGRYTDDTRLKHIIIDIIAEHGGTISSDQLGRGLVERLTGWFYTPVVNAYHKMRNDGARPRTAGRGNMASNSTAMAIAPIGLVCAFDPRAAARCAYDVASVIHDGYALDAAACIAAAVASGMDERNSATDVVDTALACMDHGSEMSERITRAVHMASRSADYEDFRARFYAEMLMPWPQVDLTGVGLPPEGFYDTAEPREAIPAALGILVVTGGDAKKAVLGAANFGRDADTIGSIVGGIAGAMSGVQALPAEWIRILDDANELPVSHYADKICDVLGREADRSAKWASRVQAGLAR